MRERIDLAFHIMDREYGVTRLLDPEGKQRLVIPRWRHSSCRIYHISAAQHKQETDWLFVSAAQIRQGRLLGWWPSISMGRGGSRGGLTRRLLSDLAKIRSSYQYNYFLLHLVGTINSA